MPPHPPAADSPLATLSQVEPWWGMPPEALQRLLANAHWEIHTPGERIVAAGDPLANLFWLDQGHWIEERPESGAPRVPFGPGTLLGHACLMRNRRWGCDLRSQTPGRFLRLPISRLRRLHLDHPRALPGLPVFLDLIQQMEKLVETVRRSPAFRDLDALDAGLLHDFILSLRLELIPGGSRVFRQGDPSDSLLLVMSGRLQAVAAGEGDTPPRLLDEIGKGHSVGEIGLLLGEPRKADVIAIRDATVAVLTQKSLDFLLRQRPIAMNRLLARFIMDHFSPEAHQRSRLAKIARTLSLLPLSSKIPLGEVAREVIRALGGPNRALLVDDRLRRELTGGDSSASESDLGVEDPGLVHTLNELEYQYEHLVYCADCADTPWTRRCLRQSDHVLLLGRAGEDPHPSARERDLLAPCKARVSLVLLHEGSAQSAALPGGVPAWLAERRLAGHHHVRRNEPEDFDRLARFLKGEAVGLVLGGGGARGFAHIGVLRALREAGVPIDAVGGNSMGALLGAQFVLGRPLEEILERTIALCLDGDRVTLPLVSVFHGGTLARGMADLFGEAHIEDAWLPFFAVSCNLSRACIMTHREGLMRRAVLASNSPVGLVPPQSHGQDLLVDGGLLNNVPVDVMMESEQIGALIGVDVNTREELFAGERIEAGLSGWSVLARRLNPFAPNPDLPGITAILGRASIIGGLANRAKNRDHDDHFNLFPPVSHFPIIGYRQGPEIAEAGYRHAREAIDQWSAAGRALPATPRARQP